MFGTVDCWMRRIMSRHMVPCMPPFDRKEYLQRLQNCRGAFPEHTYHLTVKEIIWQIALNVRCDVGVQLGRRRCHTAKKQNLQQHLLSCWRNETTLLSHSEAEQLRQTVAWLIENAYERTAGRHICIENWTKAQALKILDGCVAYLDEISLQFYPPPASEDSALAR